jgi:hypothetical protein
MVSGKPYISVNRATKNAENAPNVRQSRGDLGFEKLKAKIINTSELMITSDHKPYAGLSEWFIFSHPCRLAAVVVHCGHHGHGGHGA